MPSENEPGLYGLTEGNSSRHGDDLWGKNEFNSTFPLSLCLLMRDRGIAPVSVIAQNGVVKATEESTWSMAEITGEADDEPFYHFETAFDPYAQLSQNVSDRIDLVVEINGEHRTPLEVKLTVVPDSGTATRPEHEWAPELVVRPVTSAYAMMGVATRLLTRADERNEAKSILRGVCNNISQWNNKTEIEQNAQQLHQALGAILRLVERFQHPFLLQPIWRTKGQSLELCQNCFDVFVWSDVAVMRIPVQEYSARGSNRIRTRFLREIARHVRALYEVLTAGDYNYEGIYKGMGLGIQTDRAFAVSGLKSQKYLAHSRLQEPALSREALRNIILNGGEEKLKPERRFDAAVVNHQRNV